jgi:hypothetical protein
MKNKYNVLIFFSCLIFYSSNIVGQTSNCGTNYFETLMNSNDPNYAMRLQQIQTGINDSILSHHLDSLRSRGSLVWGVKRIPVVFHLIGDLVTTDPSFAASNIQLRINKLNEEYRKIANPLGDGVDTEIEFCLAQKDANGNVTSGIVNVTGTLGPYCLTNDATIKTFSHWDPSKYLNIWICNLTNCVEKSWGSDPAMYFTNSNTSLKYRDGVVCDPGFFNTTVLTHEIGHWLNLKHLCSNTMNTCTFDDFCGDTPFCFGSSGSNLGNNCLAPNQCTTQNNYGSSTRLVHNYMDDAEDGCRNMFTADQTTRMQLTLQNIRPGILQNSNAGCGPAPTCNDSIANGTETGIDCGGICPPCQGPTNYINCSTNQFKINGHSALSSDMVNVCNIYGGIIISPFKYEFCNIGLTGWASTRIKRYNLQSPDPNAEGCIDRANWPYIGGHKYECSYYVVYISIQECDKNHQAIGGESGNWFDFTNLNPTASLNLHDYLNYLGNPLAAGKYFKIKVASNYSNWQEHSGFIKVFEPNVYFANEPINNSQVGDNIVLNGCTVSSPINVVATNKIEILNTSALTSGSYFINTIDCNNISGFRQGNSSNGKNFENFSTQSVNLSGLKGNEASKIKNDKIAIFPNPNNGNFTITNDETEGNLRSIEIQNSMGVTVQIILKPSNSNEINIHDQPSGLYLVKLNYADKVITKKVIKQ